MGYLKIIFYGLLAFVERNPLFTLLLVLLAIFAPVVFKVAGWIILGILLAIVVLVAIGSLRLRRMRQQMEEQMRQGGFSSGGFSGMGDFSGMGGAANGMTLEELVRRMQAEADARRRGNTSSNGTTTTSSSPKSEKRVNDKVGDYVDFEEVD
ncbi:MAG: DUF4834 family protein [Alistipes sp.]|nr:DUF4834 family protein [Alistipes sp.]